MDGNLTGCVNDVTGLAAPEGVALNATNTLAYFTDQGSNTIQKCDVTANTGTLTGCVNSGATGGALSGNTQGLVFHPVLTNLVYVPSHPSTLSICPLNPDGTIGVCTDSDPGLSALVGMAFNPGGQYAYLVDSSSTGGGVTLCDVSDTDGSLSSCVNSGADNLAATVRGIAITSDSLKAYISGTDFITICDVNQTEGTLGACVASGQFTALGAGVNIALNTSETKAYVTTDVGTVAICTIDSTTRLISSCVATASSLWARTSGLALLQ